MSALVPLAPSGLDRIPDPEAYVLDLCDRGRTALADAADVIEILRTASRHEAGLAGPFCSGYAAGCHEQADALDALVTKGGR